jgi:hypothetical protein
VTSRYELRWKRSALRELKNPSTQSLILILLLVASRVERCIGAEGA